MKKTLLCTFMILLTVLALLLSSCGTQTNSTDTTDKDHDTDPVVTTGSKTDRPEDPDAGTTGTQTDDTDPATDPSVTETPEEIEISKTEMARGISRLAVRIDESMADYVIAGEYAVICYETPEGDVALVSYLLSTGEEAARLVLEDVDYAHLIKLDEGDSFALYTYYGSFYRFDAPGDLEIAAAYEVEFEYGEFSEPEDSYTYYSDSTYLCTGYNRLSTGRAGEAPEFEITLPDNFDYVIEIGKQGDLIYLEAYPTSGYGFSLIAVDASDGSWRIVKDIVGYRSAMLSEDAILFQDTGDESYYSIDLSNPYAAGIVYSESQDEYLVYADSDCIISNSSEEGLYLRIYAYDGSMLFSESLSEDDAYLMSYKKTEYGIFAYLVVYAEEGSYTASDRMLILIDVSQMQEVERKDYNALAGELELKIEEEFGLELLTGNDAILDFPGFIAEPTDGGYSLYKAEKLVYSTMSEFPEGFIAELFSDTGKGNCTEFVVCLTGTLTPTVSYSTSTPAAYAYYEETTQYIVIDISYYYYLRQNVAHELMHAIDRYLSAVTDYNAYPDWSKYLPKKFSYNYSYVDKYGNDYSDGKYTMWGSSDTYFIDAYSKTFDLEDRARLFENMFTANEYSSFLEYPHIVDRMTYLASVIRDNFKSVNESEEIPIWERCLQKAG